MIHKCSLNSSVLPVLASCCLVSSVYTVFVNMMYKERLAAEFMCFCPLCCVRCYVLDKIFQHESFILLMLRVCCIKSPACQHTIKLPTICIKLLSNIDNLTNLIYLQVALIAQMERMLSYFTHYYFNKKNLTQEYFRKKYVKTWGKQYRYFFKLGRR